MVDTTLARLSSSYKGQVEHLLLLVIRGTGPSLLGQDWMAKLRLNWGQLYRNIPKMNLDW